MNTTSRKSTFFSLAFVILASALVWQTSRSTPNNWLRTPSEPIPLVFFGMHIHRAATTTPWPTARFGSWRLWDAYVSWPGLEPEKGKWDFSVLDGDVTLAQKNDVEILLPLGLTPSWASARPSEPSGYSPGNAAEPRDIEDWREYVRTVAMRYRTRVHYYEIWNEPNLKHFFSGTPQQMLQLAREAYTILKQVDPTITVVSPSATAAPGINWLDGYLRIGGGAYADVMGFHFYVSPGAPEGMVHLILKVQAIMAKNHVGDKPLWNTEAGWLIENDRTEVKPQQGSFSRVLSIDEASAYVARCYIVNWAAGVSRFYWYSWDSEVGGLTEADGKTLKPPAKSYQQVEDWLVGARMKTCIRDSNQTWTCELAADGRSAWIVWNPSHSLRFDIPPVWNVQQIRDLSGIRRRVPSDSKIVIGFSPVLLETLSP